MPIAIVALRRVLNREGFEIRSGECDLSELFGLKPDKPKDPAFRAVRRDGFDTHRLVKKWAGEDLARLNHLLTHFRFLFAVANFIDLKRIGSGLPRGIDGKGSRPELYFLDGD